MSRRVAFKIPVFGAGRQVILHRLIKAASEMLEVQRDAEEDVKFKMGDFAEEFAS